MTKTLFILTLLLITACGQTAPPSPTPQLLPTPTPTTSPPALTPTITQLPITQLPNPPQPTPTSAPITQLPSNPLSPPTNTPITNYQSPPTPITATQPPYAPSDCSDKYPCNDDITAWEARIQVPEGYAVNYFARVDGSPTAMTFAPDGRLTVALQQGAILALDAGGTAETIADGFITPTGLAFQPGTDRLFVASRVVESNIGGEAQVSVVESGVVTPLFGGLPCCYTLLHAANGIAFGPDGFGYVAVGARADHGEILLEEGYGEQDVLHPLEAAILRFDPLLGNPEPFAHGFRNPYGLAWDGDGRLFATDNAPDHGPPEELHLVIPGAQHGYPFYDCDNCFGNPAGALIIPPVAQFVPHAAPTGLAVYRHDHFPDADNNLFVALWSAFPEAQSIIRFAPGGVDGAPFATGFAAPIAVAVSPDGRLFVADWATGILFRISYIPSDSGP